MTREKLHTNATRQRYVPKDRRHSKRKGYRWIRCALRSMYATSTRRRRGIIFSDAKCQILNQGGIPNAFLSIPNLFFFSVLLTTRGAAGGGGAPCRVVLLMPMSGRPAPLAAAAPSEVRGRPSGVLVATPGLCGSGHELSCALGTVFGVLRLCNLGLLGEFWAELIRGPIADRPVLAKGSAVGELGPKTRSHFGAPVMSVLSCLERSGGLSILARLSISAR